MKTTHDYKPVLTEEVYCIPVSPKGFLRLQTRECGGNNTLFATLIKMPGVLAVEYNGHFGANVFVRMEVERTADGHISENKLQAVIAEIKKQIKSRKTVCR